MKKPLIIATFLIPIILLALSWGELKTWAGGSGLALGGPGVSYQRSLIPIVDSYYEVGTTTKAWLAGYFDEICLTADSCQTEWPLGGGGSGGGTWSTTTSQVSGQLINYPNNDDDVVAIGDNATTTAEFYFDPNTLFAKIGGTASTTGLIVSNTIDLPNDVLQFIDILYDITLAGNPALGSNESFFGLNGIIFEGSTADTLEGLLTSEDITGSDKTWTLPSNTGTLALTSSAMTGSFDGNNFAGGAVSQGDLLYGSANATLSELTKDANATRYLSNTGTNNNPAWAQVDLTNGVTGTLPEANGGTGLTDLADNIASIISAADYAAVVALLEASIESALDTLSGITTLAVSTTLQIPNGTGPTADDAGELAHDTSDNMLILDDFVVGRATQRIWGVTVASTSPAFISAGLLAVPTNLDGYTLTRIQCHVVSGTSKVIAVEDASGNSSEDITCATTNTTDDGTLTNATYTASELSFIDFGSSVGTPDSVSISAFGQWTRE